AKPVESSFGQQLGQVATINDQSTSVDGKFAPGAQLPVPEKELVNNLIQRFNVNPRLQTSKLTMQLNPAELGSLKIDILVEGDSIKANIVAQSQQVLEMLEKSLPRLRSVLEEQGFKVDAFEVSLNADGGQQKDFFQEQFNSQQQEFSSNGSSSRKNESFDTLMDSKEEADEDTSGVNITV
ncbi:MAG TPA: flagellar hook-length control protein FliK, partial [Desulfobacterales bacterium]|nr:flagellar hook-length control protein FliK [Desulfobacterales bacterium]